MLRLRSFRVIVNTCLKRSRFDECWNRLMLNQSWSSWTSWLPPSSRIEALLSPQVLQGSPVQNLQYLRSAGIRCHSLSHKAVWCNRCPSFRRNGTPRWSWFLYSCRRRAVARTCQFWCVCLGSSAPNECGTAHTLLAHAGPPKGNPFKCPLEVAQCEWLLRLDLKSGCVHPPMACSSCK